LGAARRENAGAGDAEPLEGAFERLPGEALALAAAPIQPFERRDDGCGVQPPQVADIAAQPVVIVVSDQPSVESLDELLARQVPVALDPVR